MAAGDAPVEVGIELQLLIDNVSEELFKKLKPEIADAVGRAFKSMTTTAQSTINAAMKKVGGKAGEALGAGMSEAMLKEANKLARTAERMGKISAEAFVKGEVEATKRVSSNNRTTLAKARIQAPANEARATAQLTAARAKENESMHAATRAAASYGNALARVKEASDGLRLSEDKTERARIRRATGITADLSRRATLPVRVREADVKESSSVSNLRRVQIETAAKQEIEAARRARQIDVAESQQSEKRKTLRLQRFNALFLQLTQAGLTKVRDARRLGAQQEIQQEQSKDRAAERVLRESISRREAITRQFEARTLQNTRTTQRLIDARTSTGVLGAARGASPLGGALRSLAFIGGGALSIRAIFNSAQTFLSNFRRLGAITGATDEQLKQLRQTAIALGNDLSLPGVSAGDATEALTRLVQAGFSTEQAMGAAKGTLLLARNNMIDFSEAAQFTGSAINSFGINASDALRAVDVAQKSLIAGGGQSFTELSQAIQQSGAVFSEFFAKTRGPVAAFEDMNIALDILAKNGLRGSDAGTSLKTFLIGMTGPSEAASKKIGELSKELGITGDLFFDAAGNARPFIEGIKNLRESMKDLTQAQRLQELKLLFGTDAFRAAAIFIGQTDEELSAFEKTIRESAGASEALGKAVNQGMKAAFDNFSSVVETAGILLIEKIDKPLGAVITKFADLTSSLLQGQGVYKVIRSALAGIAVALGAILAAKGAVEVMGLLKGVLLGMTSPAGAALTIIGALGAAIGIGVTASDEFRESLGNLAAFIKTGVLQPVQEVFKSLFGIGDRDPLAGLNAGQLETLPDQIGKVADIGPKTNAVFDAIGRTINGTLIPALQTAVDFIKNTLIPGFGNMVSFINDKVLPVIGSVGRLVAEVAKLIFDEVMIKLQPIFTVISEGWHDAFAGLTGPQAAGILGFLQDVGRAVGGVAVAIGDLLKGNFGDAFGRLSDVGSSIGRNLLDAVKSIDFTSIGKTLFDLLGLAARKAGSALTTIFSEPILKAVGAAVAAALVVAGQVVANFVIGFVKGMQGRVDDIGRVLSDVMELAGKAAILGLGLAITKGVPALFGAALKAGLSGPIGALGLFIAALLAKSLLTKGLSSVGTAFTNLFQGTVTPLFQQFIRRDLGAAGRAVGDFKVKTETLNTAFRGIDREFAGTFAGNRLAKKLKGEIASAGRVIVQDGQGIIVGAGQKVGSQFAARFVSAAVAGLSGFFGGQQGGLQGLITAGVGTATAALSRLASGDAIGAGLTAAVGALGFVFGGLTRASKASALNMEAFGQATKDQVPHVKAFTEGIEAIIEKDKGLQGALLSAKLLTENVAAATAGTGLVNIGGQIGDLIDKVSGVNANNFTGFAASIDDIRESGRALISSGALNGDQATRLSEALGKLNTQASGAASGALTDLRGVLKDLADSMVGGQDAALEFRDLMKEINETTRNGVVNDAVSFSIDAATESLGKAIAEGKTFRDILPELVPFNMEDILTRQLGIPLSDLASAIEGDAPTLDAFKQRIRDAGEAAHLSGAQIDAVAFFATQLDPAFDGAEKAARAYELSAEAVRKKNAEIARENRINEIKQAWSDVNTKTQDAISSFQTYIALTSPAAAGFDQFLVDASEGFAGLAKQIEDARATATPTALIEDQTAKGAQFRLDVDKLRGQFATDFAAAIEGLPPDQVAVQTNKFFQKALDMAAALGLTLDDLGLSGLFAGLEDSPAVKAMQSALTEATELAFQNSEIILAPELEIDKLPAELQAFLSAHPSQIVPIINAVDQRVKTLAFGAVITTVDASAVKRQVQAAIALAGFPGHAEGGIITSPTLTAVGEGSKAEAIIPLTKPRRALQIMRAAGLDRLLLGGRLGSLRAAGQSIGEGAALGISSAQGMVASATAGLAGAIQTTFTRLLGIHSPSTVFEKYGRDIIDGLMKGLKEGAQAAGSAIQDFVNIFLGRTGAGGQVATGIDQLMKATKDQLAESLKEVGDTIQEQVSGQSGALSAIAEFAKGAGPSSFKDKKGKVHRSSGKFAKGFDATTAIGAENRAALIEVISTARDTIVDDLAAGDTKGATSVFKQLRDALKKVAKGKKGNQAVIDEILGGAGLGGADPLADIIRQFTEATEEMRKLTEAETARKSQQAKKNSPPVVNNNFQITSPFDPFEIARRTVAQQDKALVRAWQE